MQHTKHTAPTRSCRDESRTNRLIRSTEMKGLLRWSGGEKERGGRHEQERVLLVEEKARNAHGTAGGLGSGGDEDDDDALA